MAEGKAAGKNQKYAKATAGLPNNAAPNGKMPEKSGGNGAHPVLKPIPPDGGWGWIVVFGVALANMTTQSLVSTFGLLFGDALKSMGQETTGAALIMNVMSATTNLSGLFTGPVIKRFSYRKVAIAGGILFSSGIFFASMATNMTHLLFSYSLLSGLGLGLTGPASFVALSTYFSTRRGRAVGLALVGTGLGQMLMPQAVRALLDYYGFQGAMLLIAAVSLHAIFGASLYHPIKRHCTYPEKPPLEEPPAKVDPAKEDVKKPSEDKMASSALLQPDAPELLSLRKLSNAEMGSNLEVDVLAAEMLEAAEEMDLRLAEAEAAARAAEKPGTKRRRKLRDLMSSCWSSLVDVMDLRLFLDPVFVNIVVGLAVFNVSNINFSMVFPFFVLSLGFSRADAALCMSVTAGADIVARLLVPYLTDRVKSMGSRNTLLVAMVLLAGSRSLLAEQTQMNQLIGVSVLCGLVRGAAILNLNLSIAEYCCNEKLPAALGINMVFKGIAILSLGPFLGWLRDATGSFPLAIHAQSLLLVLTAASWVLEMVVRWRRRRHSKAEQAEAAEAAAA